MSFDDRVNAALQQILSDPIQLPAEFISFLPQIVAQNPVPSAETFNVRGVYRKSTSKRVVNTVTETDLLNGEVSIPAGILGTTGVLRLTAEGDWLNNSGANRVTPRFKLKLGSTTLLDTATIASNWAFNASRMGWGLEVIIRNLGDPKVQWSTLQMDFAGFFTGVGAATFTTGEGINQIISANLAKIIGGNSSTVDTTATQALVLTVTLPVANASLDVTLKGALVEIT